MLAIVEYDENATILDRHGDLVDRILSETEIEAESGGGGCCSMAARFSAISCRLSSEASEGLSGACVTKHVLEIARFVNILTPSRSRRSTTLFPRKLQWPRPTPLQ